MFDTIGLGLYTIIGTEIGIENNFHPIICVALGTMSACFGGVIRDVLCNKIPLVFKKEIYATASIIGGVAFIILSNYTSNQNITYVITTLIVIAIRLASVKFNLELPTFYTKKI